MCFFRGWVCTPSKVDWGVLRLCPECPPSLMWLQLPLGEDLHCFCRLFGCCPVWAISERRPTGVTDEHTYRQTDTHWCIYQVMHALMRVPLRPAENDAWATGLSDFGSRKWVRHPSRILDSRILCSHADCALRNRELHRSKRRVFAESL
jgi:hypothetical protein